MSDQLVPIPLVTPGFKGLNKAQSSVTDLDAGWAIECQNWIFDQSGRLAARPGWAVVTTTDPISGSPPIVSMGELVLANGTTFVVSAANNKLYSGTATLTDVTGALTITGNNWQWMTFNGSIYGVQAGHPLISWNGTGNFVVNPVSAGTAPTGGTCGVAAFGRLWILDQDNETIQYCNLLDSTTWSGVGAGSLNMSTVWTRGMDQVIGLAAAGAKLVIFGAKQIVLYTDSAGAAIGLNPANMIVYDTIEGTGLAARDTLQSTGEGDLTFLSPTGVQSLGRLLTSGRDNPVQPLDPQVRDYFNGYFVNEVPATIRSTYSPVNRFYLIYLPVAGRVFCYDTRTPIQDPLLGNCLRATEWPAITWNCLLNQKNGTVLVGGAGVIGSLTGYLDNGRFYYAVYNSPNIALKSNYDTMLAQRANLENKRKILKRMKCVLYYGGNTTVYFSWGLDFAGLSNSYVQTLMGNLSEYGNAQYNINEYGGGAGLSIVGFPISGSGRWLQFGLAAGINGAPFAIQQLDAFCKAGNMV